MTTEKINDIVNQIRSDAAATKGKELIEKYGTERIDRVFDYLVDLDRKLRECGDVEVGEKPCCTQACCCTENKGIKQ